MRTNDPSLCEDMLGSTESLRDSLVDCPEVAALFQSPDRALQADGRHGDHLLFAGYCPPDHHQLSLAPRESERF